MSLLVEILAAAFGIVGTLLLALNGRFAGYGFVSYLLSNLAWIAVALHNGQTSFLVQQIVFTFSSLLGIWVWIVKPRLHRQTRS